MSTELNPVAETLARRRHLEQSVRLWLGLPRSADIDTPRLPTLLERRFLRIEEYERPGRDAWGCWDHTYSENYLDGTLGVPEVDRWLVEQRAELRTTDPSSRCGRRASASPSA